MRRTDIVAGVREVVFALTHSQISVILTLLYERSGSQIPTSYLPDLFQALKTYAIAAQQYSPAAKQVAEAFELTSLEEPSTWASLLEGGESGDLYTLHRTVGFAQEYVPKLLPLIEHGASHDIEEKIESGVPKYQDMRVLTINIYEDENTFSSPLRIVNAIESVNHFYYACAMLDGKSPTTISVVGCDSGSDKSFDFLGLAQVMECVERILGQIWERVFFFREHQLDKRLDLVAKALPIVAQITKMKEHNEIDPELAELIEQNILNGTNKFIQSGATTKKIEDTSHYSPRALLTPVQRLLVSAPEAETEPKEGVVESETADSESADDAQPETSKSSKMNFENLSPAEQEAFRKLFEKATGENNQARTDSDEAADG
ncbi:MAG TPA: hypothetical protein VEX70_15930 [Pyrinomonadaceae bacterium]|nr:hypothetical protein [Pyrinomonadaceae bacterium]